MTHELYSSDSQTQSGNGIARCYYRLGLTARSWAAERTFACWRIPDDYVVTTRS